MHLERQTTHRKTNGHITKQEIQMAYKHVTVCSILLEIRIYKLKSQQNTITYKPNWPNIFKSDKTICCQDCGLTMLEFSYHHPYSSPGVSKPLPS